MLQAIIDFFKKLFGFLKPTSTKPKPPPIPPVEMPEVDPAEPQDGSEILPDTAVVIINEEEPIFEDVPPDPFGKPSDQVEIPEPEEEPTEGSSESEATPPGDEVVEVIPPTTDPARPGHRQRYLWCLDNGHGKLTKGKRSPVLDDGKTQFFEYEFNRDIVRRITEKLDEIGVAYYNVVPEIDVDNFLEGRVARANTKRSELPKIYLSIHSNAGPTRTPNDWTTASGIETWFFHGSTKGRKLAGIFQKELISRLKWRNRNIRSQTTGQFYVLRNTNMPAVLTENGFYNNREEVKLLIREDIRQTIAEAHVAAILEIEKNGL